MRSHRRNVMLYPIIEDIIRKLREGRFPNEQSISQGIVLRILAELGWDTYDTNVVWPEYQTGEGRADFGLCHPPSKPAVFIEVKQPGGAEVGVRQALEYAFHTGVPFIVLTDGKTWSFYLPAEQGSYEDRRVFKLDLFERTPEEAAKVLQRYLGHKRVASGETLDTARTEYRSRNRRSVARRAIPEAWSEIVERGDEFLVELLADAVESKAGVRPSDDDVADFLVSLSKPAVLQAGTEQGPTKPKSITSNGTSKAVKSNPKTIEDGQSSPSSPRHGTLIVSGKAFQYASAKDAMVIVLRQLANNDPTFLQRCAQHPGCRGRKRRYIAQQSAELYPDRPDLHDYHERLPGGWLVSTNLNNRLKRTIIQAAAEVAGLNFGQDLRVDF